VPGRRGCAAGVQPSRFSSAVGGCPAVECTVALCPPCSPLPLRVSGASVVLPRGCVSFFRLSVLTAKRRPCKGQDRTGQDRTEREREGDTCNGRQAGRQACMHARAFHALLRPALPASSCGTEPEPAEPRLTQHNPQQGGHGGPGHRGMRSVPCSAQWQSRA
jgi:hypothetical protein